MRVVIFISHKDQANQFFTNFLCTTFPILCFPLCVGVEHFFIYDTSTPSTRSVNPAAGSGNGSGDGGGAPAGLRGMLADYISERLVTVVPWHFSNCVRGMASGRDIGWQDSFFPELGAKFFLPPPPHIADCSPR